MWWNGELESRRREVQRAKHRIDPGRPTHALVPRREHRGISFGLSAGDTAALAFAIASIVGPLTTLRIAIAAASAFRAVIELERGIRRRADGPSSRRAPECLDR